MSEQKIPAPILDAFQKAATCDLEAAVHQGNEATLQTRITELEIQLETARAALSNVGRKWQAATDDAEHYRHMAYGRAATIGVPKELMEAADKTAKASAAPASREPGTNDVVTPLRAICVHCAQAIIRQAPGTPWHHHASGLIACYPDGVVSPEAEPVPQDDPLGQNGTEVLR